MNKEIPRIPITPDEANRYINFDHEISVATCNRLEEIVNNFQRVNNHLSSKIYRLTSKLQNDLADIHQLKTGRNVPMNRRTIVNSLFEINKIQVDKQLLSEAMTTQTEVKASDDRKEMIEEKSAEEKEKYSEWKKIAFRLYARQNGPRLKEIYKRDNGGLDPDRNWLARKFIQEWEDLGEEELARWIDMAKTEKA